MGHNTAFITHTAESTFFNAVSGVSTHLHRQIRRYSDALNALLRSSFTACFAWAGELHIPRWVPHLAAIEWACIQYLCTVACPSLGRSISRLSGTQMFYRMHA